MDKSYATLCKRKKMYLLYIWIKKGEYKDSLLSEVTPVCFLYIGTMMVKTEPDTSWLPMRQFSTWDPIFVLF